MKILIINGPNLNVLHKRNPDFYGGKSLQQLEDLIRTQFSLHEIAFFQSNSESDIITRIQTADEEFEGIIINPAAYSHTSYAIRDALECCPLPKIEVHLSQIFKRDEFRRHSVTAAACDGLISGLKEHSYSAAVFAIINMKEVTE